MTAVPMYVFTGFLESGKTRFIQQTLEDPRFNSGERTLLLVLEEGEEEYDLSTYPQKNVYLEVLDQETVTQEQLLARLQERGISSTQATISRDIKQMHLIKEPVGQGVYKYAVSGNRTKLNFAEKLRTIFRESITSIAYAQNIVVIKTMPGLASAACSALDNMNISYMVGSLAGDDTAFLLMQDTESAAIFCEEIKEML